MGERSEKSVIIFTSRVLTIGSSDGEGRGGVVEAASLFSSPTTTPTYPWSHISISTCRDDWVAYR